MLRLHNEEIEDIDGAAAEKIEDGAYLITPERDTVTISLKIRKGAVYENMYYC